MAQIEMTESKRFRRKLHSSLRIDMTPMVGLAFLLITFFIFYNINGGARKLVMPLDTKDSMDAPQSKVLAVLLDKENKEFAYEGRLEDAVQENKIITTSYNAQDGIGKLIRNKQTISIE